MHTRVDTKTTTYKKTPRNGPQWDYVIRRITYNLDMQEVIQDLLVQDQPTGYDWPAPLPQGAINISTRLYWQPPTPALLNEGGGSARPRAKQVSFIIDDRPSPLSIERGHARPTNFEFDDDIPHQSISLPTEERLKPKREARSRQGGRY